MQIEIQASEPIDVLYGEKKFTVNKPKVIFYRGFMRRMKAAALPEATEDQIDVMMEFCEQIGVPQDVLDQWSLGEMSQFFSKMSEEEKKS